MAEPNGDRVKKMLEIALDMQQAKEIRIQAVRVLKLMGAVDELWTVAKNVKCPFTKRAAIDSVPALGVKAENDIRKPDSPAVEAAARALEEQVAARPKEQPKKVSIPKGALPSVGPNITELPSVLSKEYLNGLSATKTEDAGQSVTARPTPPRPPAAKTKPAPAPRTEKRRRSARVSQPAAQVQEVGQASAEVRGRVSSGIRGLDGLIGGGFPDGSLHVISGSYGGHHLTFVQQMLYSHMISKGKVAYYLVESSSQDVMDEMSVHNWDIEKYVDDGSWKFIRLLPPSMENAAELAGQNPMEETVLLKSSLTPLRDSLLEMLREGRRCVLDISYIMQGYPHNNVVELLLYVLVALRKHAGVHFVLMTEGLLEEKVVNAVKNTVDGVFEFEGEGAIEQGVTMDVRKLRKTVLGSRAVKMTLMPSGIVAEKA